MSDEKKELQGDNFWGTHPEILYQTDRLVEFFPTYQMTMIEKLNAVTRLSVYMGIILALIFRNYMYLYIPVITLAVTYFIFYNQKDNKNLYFNSYDSFQNRENENIIEKKPCTEPTVNNPMMNFNIITDKRDRSAACDSWDSKKVQEKVEDKFNYNLYRDVSDLYGKRNSQRQYYTMPATTMPNDQTAFAKWCYSTGPTCKERSMYCAPIYSPIKSNVNAYKHVPMQF